MHVPLACCNVKTVGQLNLLLAGYLTVCPKDFWRSLPLCYRKARAHFIRPLGQGLFAQNIQHNRDCHGFLAPLGTAAVLLLYQLLQRISCSESLCFPDTAPKPLLINLESCIRCILRSEFCEQMKHLLQKPRSAIRKSAET